MYTNALLASWAWHLLARSTSHGSALVGHEAKGPAMHGRSLPGPEVGYSGEVSTLVLGHA